MPNSKLWVLVSFMAQIRESDSESRCRMATRSAQPSPEGSGLVLQAAPCGRSGAIPEWRNAGLLGSAGPNFQFPARPGRRRRLPQGGLRPSCGHMFQRSVVQFSFASFLLLISVESFSTNTLRMQDYKPPSKIVVCGAGVIGASVAYYLSLKGGKATIIDRAGQVVPFD